MLLSAALLAEHLLRRAPALTRHRLWSLVFAALLALPVLSAMLPALDVPLPRRWEAVAPARTATATSLVVRQDVVGGLQVHKAPVVTV